MEWQPLETAPKDGRVFLVWDSRAGMPVHCRWIHADNKWSLWLPWDGLGGYRDGDTAAGATHWMPLPEAPQ